MKHVTNFSTLVSSIDDNYESTLVFNDKVSYDRFNDALIKLIESSIFTYSADQTTSKFFGTEYDSSKTDFTTAIIINAVARIVNQYVEHLAQAQGLILLCTNTITSEHTSQEYNQL